MPSTRSVIIIPYYCCLFTINQILRNESRIIAISRIRWRLSVIALRNSCMSAMEAQPRDEIGDNNQGLPITPHSPLSSDENNSPFDIIPLGSEDNPLDRDSVWIQENQGYFPKHLQRPQFTRFHDQLVRYLKSLKEVYCKSYQEPPDGYPAAALLVCLHISIFRKLTFLQIQPYRQIKHTYYSLDDRLPHRDYIRCTPGFHERDRFDTILVDVGGSFRPARLHLVFSVKVHAVVWQLA